jgi:hydroxymethylglutaryl-CoA lyase
MKILETPRDAMQGLKNFIPTKDKVKLIQGLLEVGFDIIDVGSFVSQKAIPQLQDTQKVIDQLDLSSTRSKLFVLVANIKGGEQASKMKQIKYIGFPFSFSETFLKRNISSNLEQAESTVYHMQEISVKSNKKLMVYLTMAFGNPYGDPCNLDLILEWTKKFHLAGITTISLSDIIGIATPEQISFAYSSLTKEFPTIEFGIHLHIKNDDWYDKINAAYDNGCEIFDGVINGMGGCPMTGFEMVRNLPTSYLLQFALSNNIYLPIKKDKFEVAQSFARKIFTGQ